jgi:hypothetical protein
MAETDKALNRARLFTVRIWTEPSALDSERRGRVRDVVTGAFRNFRDWPELTAFLAEQLAEHATTAMPYSDDGTITDRGNAGQERTNHEAL